MMRKTVLLSMMTLLLIGAFSLVFSVELVKAESKTWTVDDDGLADFRKIQDAINAASAGDTVYVHNGTYYEQIVVNKTVTLMGENKEATFIEGSAGILVVSDNVVVREFTIRNILRRTEAFGIWVQSSHCLLANNTIIGSPFAGIFLDGRAGDVKENVVVNNYLSDINDPGILIWGSEGNLIKSNIVTRNMFGIYLYSFGASSTGNTIQGNEITSNLHSGLVMNWHSSNNVIANNNISNNGWGGEIWMSGIVLNVNSEANKIISNRIVNNKMGMWIYYYSNNNVIHHNSFINNTVQVLSDTQFPSTNIWDEGYPFGGNYWSDYAGVDEKRGPYQNETGSDGIGDTSYIIGSNNVDTYPLMKPYVRLLCDLNDDRRVDIKDLAIVAVAFGSHNPGSSRWNPIADVIKDGQIDIRDVAFVARNFGKTYP